MKSVLAVTLIKLIDPIGLVFSIIIIKMSKERLRYIIPGVLAFTIVSEMIYVGNGPQDEAHFFGTLLGYFLQTSIVLGLFRLKRYMDEQGDKKAEKLFSNTDPN